MLDLIDAYGATFVIFILAVLEIYTFCYIYGVKRVSDDVKFMLDFRPGVFWKICWGYVTPAIMTLIAGYALWNYERPTYNGKEFPMGFHVLGWCIASLGLMWVPIVMIMRILKQKEITVVDVSEKIFYNQGRSTF
jgi:solute carrier family 6 amino acid transporter-like protein 5/7/9/14